MHPRNYQGHHAGRSSARVGKSPDGVRSAFGGFPRQFGLPWGGPMGPRGHGRGHGGRARRGDVRAAVLALLAERPMHGYEIIQELAERTNGIWKVSPGSVYPTLQMLEDEDLVVAEEEGGKRRFSLTEAGRVAATDASGGKPPWEDVLEGVDPGMVNLRSTAAQLMAAVIQIGQAGSSEQQTEATKLLDETRRRLYSILAEDE